MTRWQWLKCKLGIHDWGWPVEVEPFRVMATCIQCRHVAYIWTDTEWS